MKVKQITIGGSYTYQPIPYHSIRGEFQIVAEVDEEEDTQSERDEIGLLFVEGLMESLNQVTDVHKGVEGGTITLGSTKTDDDDDIIDDDDDWT